MKTVEGQTLWNVGDVADSVGVSRQTLRVWENQGLLEPTRSPGGQRLYTEDDFHRARQVARLRKRGWNSAAIKSFLVELPAEGRRPSQPIGDGIRAARLERGLTLEETAEMAGISKSFLSSVERGESGISSGLASRIVDVLGIPMGELAPRLPTKDLVVRGSERPETHLADGIVWQELVPGGHTLESSIITVPPGRGSDGLYSRPGETFVLVLEGQITIHIPSRQDPVTLDTGDSMILPEETDRAWQNQGETESRLVWVERIPSGLAGGAQPED